MSRSFKKRPFAGVTNAVSEKEDKRIAHRRARHAVRQILHTTPTAEVLPHHKDFGDKREFSKDGKYYVLRFTHSSEFHALLRRRLSK